ncbi:Sphingolipid long chain base-responsive protein PIL1 like [Verticillium longisporum]|uniref:Sphingolipid long chain base-responsive protein PIL1 like n=1 Tax=Verticillium longisporum TaxID=100787 RepID=A0A8I2ZK68_VERLO|nr:Sphingolipid long chain base-responsive protein PIL1 like [Verticillium longisporum]
MHRTYSMRQTRAPTASQLQNPPPPTSSTKSGRLFGRGGFGHAIRHKSAGAFGPDLAKKLSQLVKMEKNVMRSLETVAKERMEVAQQLSIWGRLATKMFPTSQTSWEFCCKQKITDQIAQLKNSGKQKITDQIAQLKYKEPNSPKIVVLEQELVRAEAESLVAEAQLSNITREKIKAAYTYQFDALREHCEKVAIIAGYGKHLLELIDDTPVTPGETRQAYDGYEASKAIIQDCEDSLTSWVTSNAAVSSKLSTRSRTLSTRRRNNIKAREQDLSGQDAPLNDDSSWMPATRNKEIDDYSDEDELDEDDHRNSVLESDTGLNGETRGRQQEAVAA